jgi:rhodanese-related sulfurtransferase
MKRSVVLIFMLALIGCSEAGQNSGVMAQADLVERLDDADAPLVLDVRTPGEYRRGHVPGALNIPYQQLGARFAELGAVDGRDIVVYCEAGPRAERAEATLAAAGLERLYQLEGHMAAWRRNHMPMQVPR